MSCRPANLFVLVNFQGNVLELAGTVNPSSHLPQRLSPLNQQYIHLLTSRFSGYRDFDPQGSGIISAVPEVEGFSVVGWDSTSHRHKSPSLSKRRWFKFPSVFICSIPPGLSCVNSTSTSFLDVITGLALTAWPAVDGAVAARLHQQKVTFETFTGRREQLWSMLSLD
ncbi:hypothetical protein B0H13DRAFT_1894852 [Mycena leptocephala]|nr:hypothetical protein B0H13DRAFT_1894852 [Mycena leptocephala]